MFSATFSFSVPQFVSSLIPNIMEPISKEKLYQLVDWEFSPKQMAIWFGVSRSTIHRKMKEHNICVKKFSNICDEDLMQVISNVLAEKSNMGISH